MKHKVVFHIEDRIVVCSCGCTFTTPPAGFAMTFTTGVTLWAAHLRDAKGLNLHDAYEAGWADACSDHLRQRKDPSHPIGDSKRISYPHPATHGKPAAKETP